MQVKDERTTPSGLGSLLTMIVSFETSQQGLGLPRGFSRLAP
jgi:hypothetical protein